MAEIDLYRRRGGGRRKRYGQEIQRKREFKAREKGSKVECRKERRGRGIEWDKER